MPNSPNTNNSALFAGSIAENYHRYLVPLIFDDIARELAERATVPAGGRVLEVACGTGVLTGYLRKSMPGSSKTYGDGEVRAPMQSIAITAQLPGA